MVRTYRVSNFRSTVSSGIGHDTGWKSDGGKLYEYQGEKF